MFEEQDTGYFCDILADRMQTMKLTCVDLVNILTERGYDVKIRQMQRYKTGLYVPKYEVAAQICKIIMFEMSDSQLEKLLAESRLHADTLRKRRQKNLGITACINPKNIHLGSEIEARDVAEIQNNRVFELYGSQSKMSNYIEALIELDLKNNLIKAKEGE